MSKRTKILLGAFLTIALLPLQARAHFCDDLWTSSYNIVVRPEADTVTLSASGTGTMNITVQNNMGFALINFVLTAKIGTTAITATRQAGKISGTTLHPGERGQYTLSVTGTGGGAVKIESVSFFVAFGNSGENKCYPTQGGQAVMVRKTDGTLVPTGTPPGLATIVAPGGGCTGELTQARQLQYAAQTDFIDVNAGLDKLMTYYCAGRGTWNQNSDAVTTAACTGTTIDCTKATRALSAGNGTKYDYAHLWGALELAVRKNSLGTRLAPLRLGLQCGAGDANTGFAGFAMMMLGYLGDDPGARTFLTGKAGGTGDLATIAKAALLLFGTAADKTTYEAAVKAGLTGDVFVSAACAAALGIVENDDADVTSVLVPAAKWTEPDTSDNGQGFYAAHLLALVAWSRRGWAAAGADTGTVSFYESGTTPTGGSTGTGGTTGAGGSGGGAGAGGSSARGGSGGTPVGGSSAAGGSSAVGGSSARGGSTGTPVGGSTGTLAGGSTAIGGSTAAAGSSAAGGSSARGGSTGTSLGGSTGTPSGGSTGTPVGGSTGTPSGGSTETPSGGSTGVPQGSSSAAGGGGNTGAGTSANTGGGSGAQGGNGSSPSSGTASQSGSAGGCGYAPSGRTTIPLGFLLAGVGLALTVRRRRRR